MQEPVGEERAEDDGEAVGEGRDECRLSLEHCSQRFLRGFLRGDDEAQSLHHASGALRQFAEKWGVDGSEDGCGDANGCAFAFDSQLAGIAFHESLGAAVNADDGPIHPSRNGRDVEDETFALLLHKR